MDNIQYFDYIIFLLLAALSFVCGLATYPWQLTVYNTRKLPLYIRPDRDYMEREHPYYYPAAEARRMLAAGFFLGFLLIAVGIIKSCPQALESVFLWYACLPACYVLHRCFCFHKVNRFTPAWVMELTGRVNIYRVWKAVLVWGYAAGILLAGLFHWLSPANLQWLTLIPAGAATLLQGAEIINEYLMLYRMPDGKGLRFRFTDFMPNTYYLAFLLAGVALTQAALWTAFAGILAVWVVGVIAFTAIEYHLRFVSNKNMDMEETWGVDESRFLFAPWDELEQISRWERELLKKKDSPCWVLLLKRQWRYRKPGYAIELSTDLWVKQGEMNLRQDELLYIKGYPDVPQARRAARELITHPEEQEARILEMNPERKDLNYYSSEALSEY